MTARRVVPAAVALVLLTGCTSFAQTLAAERDAAGRGTAAPSSPAGDQVDPGGEHVVARDRPHRVDGRGGDQPVAGPDRSVVGEPLLAVHHPAVVDRDLGVLEDDVAGTQAHHDGEGGRGDDVGVTGGPGGRGVPVDRVGVTERRSELGDLLPPDLVDG